MSRITLLIILLLTCSAGGARDWSSVKDQENFRFWIVADTEVGPQNTVDPNLRVPNAALRSFVQAANTAEKRPDFLVFNGDLVVVPSADSFANFEQTLEPWDAPILLVRGSRDGGPANNQFAQVQGRMGLPVGDRQVLEIGSWRLLILPPPEVLTTPAQREELLQWVTAELSASPAPTMVFHHYPVLPIGASALVGDALPMAYRKQLLNVLTGNGNVKYVFVGHAQTGVRASIRTSRTYKGVAFITTPTSMRARSIEKEYDQFLVTRSRTNDSRYFIDVAVEGTEVSLAGAKSNSQTQVAFPELEPYDETSGARFFDRIGDLPAFDELRNGGFEAGLDGWTLAYRYRSEVVDNYIARTQQRRRLNGVQALELTVDPLGTNWARDESLEAYQVVNVSAMAEPTLSARYLVARNGRSHFGGGYLRFHAYSDGDPVFAVVTHWGARESKVMHLPRIFTYHDNGQSASLSEYHASAARGEVVFYELADPQGAWQPVTLNLAQIYNMYHPNKSYGDVKVDKVLVAFGVWTGPDARSSAGGYLDDVSLTDWPGSQSELSRRPLRHNLRHLIPPYGTWFLD